MGKNAAHETLKYAREMLERDDLVWISESALRLRAFYWGVLCGLGPLATEESRDVMLKELMLSTMFAKPGEDLFRNTILGKQLETVRHELLRSAQAEERATVNGAGVAAALEPLTKCIEQLDTQWSFHRELIRHQLEEMVHTQHSSAQAALTVLERLDESFRFLSVGAGPSTA
jgi:hypothetical protein